MIEELKDNKSNIDKEFAIAEERRLKHDVMAHNHTYGKVE
jgi:adenylosuccinate lyase